MALAVEANLPSTGVGFLQIIVGGVMSATLIVFDRCILQYK
jgi:hypothetical protein